MQRTLRVAFLSLVVGLPLACIAGGCGGGGGGAPVVNVADTWNGTWRSANGINAGAVSLSLQQNGATVSGQVQFSDSPCFSGGVFSGSVSGSSLRGSLLDGAVRVDLSATVATGSLNGSYIASAGTTCTGDSGTFSASNGPPPTPAARLYVRVTGSDTNSGANAGFALRTLGRAAELVRDGSKVIVGPGTYQEGVAITSASQGLMFLADPSGQQTGDAPGAVVIDGTDTGEAPGFDLVGSAGSIIDGFTITGFGDAGIVVRNGSDNLRVQNCIVFANPGDGIRVQDSANVLVFNNLIYGNTGSGVALVGASTGSANTSVVNNTIVGNQARGLTVGTSTRASAGAFVHNNIIQDSGSDFSIKVFAPAGYQGDFNLVLPSTYSPTTVKGRHDVALDAQFVNAAAGDFHLLPTSPALNVGDSLNGMPDLRTILRTLTATGGTACDKSALDLGYHYPPTGRCTAVGP